MDGSPFVVSALINGNSYAQTLIDSGCAAYGTVSKHFANRHHLERLRISPRTLEGVNHESKNAITEVARVDMDIDGHRQAGVFLYVIPDQRTYDVIMGKPWMEQEDVVLSPRRAKITIHSSGTEIWSDNFENRRKPTLDCTQVTAQVFRGYIRRTRRQPNVQLFGCSLHDIEKALRVKTPTDPRTKLPAEYQDFLTLFDHKKADQLPPFRKGVDHEINLETDPNGRELEPPYGPMYNMSRDELLVLRKTLTELLDKDFIRVSQSPAAAPVLFAKKPGGGLRFCVDYRALNAITKKDRYPLPLFNETLRALTTARWFTKLDVRAAFHKIRVKAGDEWKTAFRTRYGLYEWNVTPFGLTGAPATFQRYMNWALRKYLDDFVSAYIDDVLIFSSGSLEDHRTKVRKVLACLDEAGLQLDIDKCEFEQHSVKYLGFIISAGKGIEMDPAKVKAISDWEPPKTVKAIRSFLGFANFYRRFIPNFSDLARPLTTLTRKGALFQWNEKEQNAFQALKQTFVQAPVLAQFSPDAETILEADSSGWAVGGVLSQYDEARNLRPVAYFSKKNLPAECNYDIGDKEMLAIIRCLEEWKAELRSVQSFTILTDHKNLQQFMTKRRLTERQIRWAQYLADFNFQLTWRPGVAAITPDALSRREQELPTEGDERLIEREMQIFDPRTNQISQAIKDADSVIKVARVTVAPTTVAPTDLAPEPSRIPLLEDEELRDLWKETMDQDPQFEETWITVSDQRPSFPKELNLRLSIAECQIINGVLCYRGRYWVPNGEPLRTKIMQTIHDSAMSGHPGRHSMLDLMSRSFFWPNVSQDVRRFVRNCAVCGQAKPWREKKQGLLKPLPVPDRVWSEISMDFITDLPPGKTTGATCLMVICDRLGKGKIYEAMVSTTAEAVAQRFLDRFVRYHGFPAAIVSDRGVQFVSQFWKRLCQRLDIKRRLSTAYHPETDGTTERANQELEIYLRSYGNYAQDNWEDLLPMAELASNNRTATATGVSPFFLNHGYHAEIIPTNGPPTQSRPDQASPIERADNIANKLKETVEWCNVALASAQEQYERYTNRRLRPSVQLKVGDRVWLNLRNLKTGRACKKLDWKNGQFRVTRVISAHAYELDTPQGIHNVFHISLLRSASEDAWPSQVNQQQGPPAIFTEDGAEEYEIEDIAQARTYKNQRQVLVKWTGYTKPTWEPIDAMAETAALGRFEAAYGPARENDGPAPRARRRKRGVLSRAAARRTSSEPRS